MDGQVISKQADLPSKTKKVLLVAFGMLGIFFTLFVFWVGYMMWFSG